MWNMLIKTNFYWPLQ